MREELSDLLKAGKNVLIAGKDVAVATYHIGEAVVKETKNAWDNREDIKENISQKLDQLHDYIGKHSKQIYGGAAILIVGGLGIKGLINNPDFLGGLDNKDKSYVLAADIVDPKETLGEKCVGPNYSNLREASTDMNKVVNPDFNPSSMQVGDTLLYFQDTENLTPEQLEGKTVIPGNKFYDMIPMLEKQLESEGITPNYFVR